MRHVFDFAKFGRDVAYHAWSSKAWGLSLALALVLLLGFGVSGLFVWVAVWLGILARHSGAAGRSSYLRDFAALDERRFQL
jgi:CDP-diacylglycerol--glycerol-3-phosphate 3-phosphatidyltransferase